ncbi:MAG: polyprenyl diphosphate synthase [Parvibaculales bacterium]
MDSDEQTLVSKTGSPDHVAIIMDGNGRWAEARGLPRSEGHRKGVDAVRNLVEYLVGTNLKTLTLYAFSTENWQRPAGEINFLMGLLKRYISQDLEKLHKQNVKILVAGSTAGLSEDILKLIAKAHETTKDNDALTLQVAFNYGSWDEITSMVRTLVGKAQSGEISKDEVDAGLIRSHLMTADVPDPDLIIRTSGEFRLSNFMLMQSAYAELVFQQVLWPDYTTRDYDSAVQDFRMRDRRFGKAMELDVETKTQEGLEASR